MKTDLEKFKELYSSLGIELVVVKEIGLPYDNNDKREFQTVSLQQKWSHGLSETKDTISDKFSGFSGFYSTISFDMEGKFVQQAFWE